MAPKTFFLTPNSINSVHTYADTFNFDWPSVHTYPVNTVDDYAIFLKRVPEGIFLKYALNTASCGQSKTYILE